ncbi:MAG: NAD-dependent epimerase/dehydratase family protein [Clostridia bacterium]|nr:NAD-dependent epimerase/dehydratase family protein [Clostridia bacterium]
MKNILITGGTVFISRYLAEYYVSKGENVYVINRNTKKQSVGVKLIESDRHFLGDRLKKIHFDLVIDTGYTAFDVDTLLDSLGSYSEYVFISSSAVYPENTVLPFSENDAVGKNSIWGTYGINKIEAENLLMKRNPLAYILRPPYLYGEMNNLYREGFVFDCALNNRKFYLPQDGEMKLQFFCVSDLCRFIDIISEKKPDNKVFNLGNKDTVSIKNWVEICYNVVGKKAEFINVYKNTEQRNYFCFYDYEYCLDVSKQYELMEDTLLLSDGLNASFEWYKNNRDKVNVKPYFEFIDKNL